MEIQEIQEALEKFIPLVREANKEAESKHHVREHMLIFLQKVLGYDLNEDIVLQHLVALPKRPKETNFDQKVKFVMIALASKTPLDEEHEELAIEYALAAATNVVMSSNGVQLSFYSVDLWEDNWEIDTLVEINLLEDNPEEIAPTLWPLAKKDCGRKILVNISST